MNGRKSSGRKDGEKLRFLIELGKMGGKVGGEVEVGRGRMREAPSELMLLVLGSLNDGLPVAWESELDPLQRRSLIRTGG